jgi:RNA polymerase sigma factor (sigma-70 family)
MSEDKILWDRFREGDRNAFTTMIQTYYLPLFEYGRRFESNKDALKDHVHDLFANLWERRTSLGPTDQIKPYLLKSLKNRIFKEKKHSDMFATVEEELIMPERAEDDAQTKMIYEESVEIKKQQIRYVLGKLTKRQQEIIHLKYYQNLSNDQIAEVLCISRPAAANLLYQALKVFRQQWEMLFASTISCLLTALLS